MRHLPRLRRRVAIGALFAVAALATSAGVATTHKHPSGEPRHGTRPMSVDPMAYDYGRTLTTLS